MTDDLILNASGSIPLRWVDEIFRRLSGRFGAQFTEKFRSGVIVDQRTGKLLQQSDSMDYAVDAGIEEAKKVWAEELDLARISPDQIKRGLLALHQYPPSCDAFIRACLGGSDLDPESLFYRAQAEMAKRRARRPQNWPSSMLFWAAASLGNDLLHSDYRSMRGRWMAALDSNRHHLGDIPDVSDEEALPAPELSQQDVQVRIADVQRAAKRMKFPSDNRVRLEWAFKIADETARGVYRGGMSGKRLAAEAIRQSHQAVPESLQPFLAKTKPMEDAA
ncbi:hypothetical protein [Chromobacterium haemolyticum]|uniref:hypothetical protein n=1 Tax=Chromobacterium haemolyticum TaxID=394935 RepID=UPI0009DAEBF2|nr:hypothetical protein [Chromobacterium haemolyticum]OQS33005.1 hypothetical protein B0T39_21730 [Chromobacterium haemolyticum]